MKYFLAVFDGFKISNSTLQYALQLSKSLKANVTGITLPIFETKSLVS